MDRTERVELTTMILVEDKLNNRVLLQNRVKKDYQGYTLPGGHVEPGESITDCAKRELREETGLIADTSDLELCGIKQFPIEGGRYIVFIYKTSYNHIQEVTSSKEGEMKWLDRSQLGYIKKVSDFDSVMLVVDKPRIQEFLKNDNDWRLI